MIARCKNRIFIMTALALCTLFLAACDWEYTEPGSYKRFDWDLHGTWTSNESESRYTGTLIIDYSRITITGYSETQTLIPGGNDTERPFRNFTKAIALEGYTEELEETGEMVILIKNAGTWQEPIPYVYWSENPPPDFKKVEFLLFDFGGRRETLRKQE